MQNGNTDFVERLRSELGRAGGQPEEAPPEPNGHVVRYGAAGLTAPQLIGCAITRLTWKDAEAMGRGIQERMKDGVSLTHAIQAWAEDWEKFE